MKDYYKTHDHPNKGKQISDEQKLKMSASMKIVHEKNPQLAAAASKRMKTNNPSTHPETIKKIKEHWKKYGHPLSKQQLRGGNGRPLPQAQRILWAALGLDWKVEFPIRTKMGIHSGYPSCYKADIALPEAKVWIELDGWGHSLPKTIQQDKKKEDFLSTLGWNGLRFKNEEIIQNLETTLSTIYKFLNTHPIM